MFKTINPDAGCHPDNFNRNATMACDKHIFDPKVQYGYSLVEELDLPPCTEMGDWPLKAVVSQMAFINMGYMFGMLVGSFVFGIISDKIGRRKALLLSAILAGSTSLGSAFIKSYWPYFVMRLLLGISAKGLFMLAFMICVEISGVDYKTYLGILIQVLDKKSILLKS
jgi:OCT family organic cation transporter-like MFS transporter 4/5